MITLPFRVEMYADEEIYTLKLTRQERQTLKGLMEGLTNKEIASNMHLSERTVKFHVSQLLRKLGVRSRVDIVRHFHGQQLTPEELRKE